MATQAKIAMRAVRTLSGSPIPVQDVPEKATRTFTQRALCFMNAGYLDECGADPALILGIARTAGSNTTADGTARNQVELAHPDNLFRGYFDDSGGEGTGTTAATDIFKKYGVAKAASGGVWFVDKADTTNNRVTIWEFWSEPGYAVGDIRTHVIFGFLYANFQGNIGT
jgi:hypothetical protein